MMDNLSEIRRDEDLYYSGPFWIECNSVKDMLHGDFHLISTRYPTDYHGRIIDNSIKSSRTHKNVWRATSSDKPYDYYPRGRVAIYDGTAYIHIHHLCNTPRIIDAIIKEYEIQKLDIEIECNDETQGSHYNFLIK